MFVCATPEYTRVSLSLGDTQRPNELLYKPVMVLCHLFLFVTFIIFLTQLASDPVPQYHTLPYTRGSRPKCPCVCVDIGGHVGFSVFS